jgi:hypothetical protein
MPSSSYHISEFLEFFFTCYSCNKPLYCHSVLQTQPYRKESPFTVPAVSFLIQHLELLIVLDCNLDCNLDCK